MKHRVMHSGRSLTPYITRHLGSIKLAEQLCPLLRSFSTINGIFPGCLAIVKKCLPDASNNPVVRPHDITEYLVIPLGPHCPQTSSLNENPNVLKFFKPV
jgi:hypothetical protein